MSKGDLSIKKFFCLLLAVFLCLSTLSMYACGDGVEEATEEVTQGQTSSTVNTENKTKETLDIPSTRYDGEELVFATRWDGAEWDSKSIYAERDQIGEDPLSEAVYIRNDRIPSPKFAVTPSIRRRDFRFSVSLRSTPLQAEKS